MHPNLTEAKIIDSWHKNAAPWIEAIQREQIESRTLITNSAILDAIASRAPQSALDLGCGEGWLTHHLAAQGIKALGTDAVPVLIHQARAHGKGRFQLLSYEEIACGAICETFDVVVSNFALLGNESVQGLFRVMPQLLTARGAWIVQTIHPVMGCGDLPYVDGWRPGSWAGFEGNFTDPPPWFFRTIESWIRLFAAHGLALQEIREPIHPKTQKPASIIFIGVHHSQRSCSPVPQGSEEQAL